MRASRFLTFLGLVLVGSLAQAQGQNCPTGDCIAHQINTQSACTEEVRGPQGKAPGWDVGLSSTVDQRVLGGKIAAYQIRWSSGWSGWIVPGSNDIDHKYNPGANTMRRLWAYFTDHEHRFIICR